MKVKLEIEHADLVEIRSRLIFEKAAQLDAAREADKGEDPFAGDPWREQAAKTDRLLQALLLGKD